MHKNATAASPPSRHADIQIHVMEFVDLQFRDDFDEYLARADSGGSTYGLLRKHHASCGGAEEGSLDAEERNLGVGYWSGSRTLNRGAFPSRRRSRSLVPAVAQSADSSTNGKTLDGEGCDTPTGDSLKVSSKRRSSALPCKAEERGRRGGDVERESGGRRGGGASVEAGETGKKEFSERAGGEREGRGGGERGQIGGSGSTEAGWTGESGEKGMGERFGMTLNVSNYHSAGDHRRHSSSDLRSSGIVSDQGKTSESKKRTSHVDPATVQALRKQLLDVNRAVLGTTSLCSADVDDGDEPMPVLRRRSFSVTPSGSVVNEGDDVVPVTPDLDAESSGGRGGGQGCDPWCAGGLRSSVDTSVHRVLMLGGPGVGKTALTQQFLTSEFMAAQDTSFDDGREICVPVLLDGMESTIEFIDLPYSGELDVWQEYDVDAYIVVYSITDRKSYQKASLVVASIRGPELTPPGASPQAPAPSPSGDRGRRDRSRDRRRHKPLILVANKSDLERSRTIGKEEGKALAKNHDSKYIEVSAILNHKVDDLLVGTLKQIRLYKGMKAGKRSFVRGSAPEVPVISEKNCLVRTKNNVLARLFRYSKHHPNFTSRSCENLLAV